MSNKRLKGQDQASLKYSSTITKHTKHILLLLYLNAYLFRYMGYVGMHACGIRTPVGEIILNCFLYIHLVSQPAMQLQKMWLCQMSKLIDQ